VVILAGIKAPEVATTPIVIGATLVARLVEALERAFCGSVTAIETLVPFGTFTTAPEMV